MSRNTAALRSRLVKTPSKRDVERAGDEIRSFMSRARAKEEHDGEAATRFLDALGVADWWRAEHADALTKATMGLRSRYQTALGAPPRVTQRHKRMSTIVDKLGREPGMRLDRMHDIAGCRAVVDTLADQQALLERYHDRPPPEGIRKEYDYVTIGGNPGPKPDGYRAIHVIVNYDGKRVEVQIRTLYQHAWAEAIESLGSDIRADLKSGHGPKEVHQFMSAVAEAMAHEDRGEPVPDVLSTQITTLRATASRFFGGQR